MEEKYGIIKQEKFLHPVKELLVVPHKGKNLTVGFPAFGKNTYQGNLIEIGKDYSHPITGEKINFRPATTSESISTIAHDFENLAKPKIFDLGWFQAGYIVRTQEGVFTNTTETNEANLKQLLNKAEKINEIYLIDDKIGFAPYESFETGVQDIGTFAQDGLARVLEHTTEKISTKLKEIVFLKYYKNGINVCGFWKPQHPILNAINFNSKDLIEKNHNHFLNIYGDWLIKDHLEGYTFGVLDKD